MAQHLLFLIFVASHQTWIMFVTNDWLRCGFCILLIGFSDDIWLYYHIIHILIRCLYMLFLTHCPAQRISSTQPPRHTAQEPSMLRTEISTELEHWNSTGLFDSYFLHLFTESVPDNISEYKWYSSDMFDICIEYAIHGDTQVLQRLYLYLRCHECLAPGSQVAEMLGAFPKKSWSRLLNLR